MAKRPVLLDASSSSSYRLAHNISAIQACYGPDGRAELGAITHLPGGAEVTFCGDGFNENTLKVRWEGQYYFVFHNEIQPGEVSRVPRKPGKTQIAKILSTSNVA